MKTALTEFYKENYKNYLDKAKRSLGDHHYAEDCVQEAFENALRYSNTFDKEKDLENWFNMVFINTMRDYFNFVRSQGVVTELTIKDHPSFPSELVEKYKGVIGEEIKKFTDCPRKQHILEVYFITGFPARAASIVCECTESVIYNLSHRFRIHLEAKYDK